MARSDAFFHSAAWYDRSINWPARLQREIPLLREVFGPPGEAGLLDAGCGTGRQTVELARLGHCMTGLDASDEMLALAREHAERVGVAVPFVSASFDEASSLAPGPFDGAYCVGNALAACGEAAVARRSVAALAAVLRPGGRLLIQVLNFPPMRAESPCVRGPRVVVHDGVEHVSARTFHFHPDGVDVTNVTLYREDGWRCHAHGGRLYPMTPDELENWCEEAGLEVIDRFGAYDRTPFDADESVDLILVAVRRRGGKRGQAPR